MASCPLGRRRNSRPTKPLNPPLEIFKAAYSRPPAQAEIELARSFLEQFMTVNTCRQKRRTPKGAKKNLERLTLSKEETIRIFKGNTLELEATGLEASRKPNPPKRYATLYSANRHGATRSKAELGSWRQISLRTTSFIMQLTGEASSESQVIDSTYCHLEANFACLQHPSPQWKFQGHRMEELGRHETPLQEASVEHEVASLSTDPSGQFLGGRSNGQH